jgi:excisionase family DNA binding protein
VNSGRIKTKEAALRLGVHPDTLRRWAHEGIISYWAVGKGRYMEFDPRDIEALEASWRRDRNSPPVQYRGRVSVQYGGIDLDA